MCMVELKSEKTKMRKTNKETTNGERREHVYRAVVLPVLLEMEFIKLLINTYEWATFKLR